MDCGCGDGMGVSNLNACAKTPCYGLASLLHIHIILFTVLFERRITDWHFEMLLNPKATNILKLCVLYSHKFYLLLCNNGTVDVRMAYVNVSIHYEF